MALPPAGVKVSVCPAVPRAEDVPASKLYLPAIHYGIGIGDCRLNLGSRAGLCVNGHGERAGTGDLEMPCSAGQRSVRSRSVQTAVETGHNLITGQTIGVTLQVDADGAPACSGNAVRLAAALIEVCARTEIGGN